MFLMFLRSYKRREIERRRLWQGSKARRSTRPYLNNSSRLEGFSKLHTTGSVTSRCDK
jgi:hypothetical protein